MEDNFDFVKELFGMFGNQQKKECCTTCGHHYCENSRNKCKLFKDAKPYPNDDKCVFYVKKKES